MAILAALLAAGLVSTRHSAASPRAVARPSPVALPQDAILVTVQRAGGTKPIPAGFLGLSFEYSAALHYAGKDPGAVDPLLVQLIRNLVPGQDPVLRIGGVTTDLTWWPVAGLHRPGGVTYTLTHRRLAVLSALARAVSARLILGVNFEADSPLVVRAETQAMLTEIGGRRIAAFELGNEPELYSSFPWYHTPAGASVFSRPADWGFTAFNQDYARVVATTGRVPLGGPTVGSLPWVNLDQFLAAEPRLAVVTLHRYPLFGCFNSPASPTYPTLANLLSQSASSGLAESLAPYVVIAHARHLPLRNDEMNSVSCGNGNGVANVFASALWALDALFAMARAGVDGVNIHMAPAYPDRLFALRRVHSRWQGFVEPEYYGLLMFARAAPPGSRLLQVSGATGTVRAWATEAHDGRIRVVLINDDTTSSQTLAVRVPGVRGAATLERLQARNAIATHGVTLGGQSFGARTTTGVLVGSRRTFVVRPVAGNYILRMPAASAATLTLAPS